MKIPAFILTVYLAALALYPCSDRTTCSNAGLGKSKAKIELSKHNHAQDSGDRCTPFCICSCCSATIRLTTTEVAVTGNEHHTLHLARYVQRPLLSNAYAIWQPPRLA